MATEFHKKWETTKKEYESLVGKKPNSKILNKFRIRHTGITAALTKGHQTMRVVQDAMADLNPKKTTQALAAARSAHKAYLGVKASYMKELNSELAAAEKAMKADEKSVQQRGLKFLAKELEAIATEWDGEIAMIAEVASAGIQAQNNAEAMVASWSKQVRAGVDRASAEIAKVKANPTVDNYNKRIWSAARNVETEVTRAEKFPGVGVLAKRIAPRLVKYNAANRPAPAQLPPTSTRERVLKEVDTFSKLIKEVDGLTKIAHTLK